jgi:hypothetical protein
MTSKLINGTWFSCECFTVDLFPYLDLDDYYGENPPFLGVVMINPHPVKQTGETQKTEKKWRLLKSNTDSVTDLSRPESFTEYGQYEEVFVIDEAEVEFPYSEETVSELYLRWQGRYAEKSANQSPTDLLDHILHG